MDHVSQNDKIKNNDRQKKKKTVIIIVSFIESQDDKNIQK